MRRSLLLPCVLLFAGTAANPQRLLAQGSATPRRPLPSPGPSVSAAIAPAPTRPIAPPPTRPIAPAAPKMGPAALAVGTWTGTLPIADQSVALSLVITRQGGTYGATLDIPGGTVRQRRLQVSERSDTLRMSESTLSVQFTCAVSPDGQVLSGRCTWAQIGSPMPMAFRRGAASNGANGTPGNGEPAVRVAYGTKWENGTLENGQPVGVWNYYRLDGAGDYVLTRSYDYTARRLTFARAETEAFDTELRPGVWEQTVLSQAPWFIGRHDALAVLGNSLNYPTQAKSRGIQGKVWVTFAVDTLGRVSDHRILKGLGGDCDQEALRIARTIPDTWTPGRLGGKAVAARKTIIFSFKL